jgi:HoxN/HupN/NixA family high-affinity nickel-transporter
LLLEHVGVIICPSKPDEIPIGSFFVSIGHISADRSFTAGMTLVDTTDGILMVGAYGWAFMKPIRKLYYNLTITFLSVIIALMVGGIEAIGLLKDHLSLTGGFWDFIGNLKDNFGALGFVILESLL